ncbi:MAG: helix-turn-helix transcriptional regulator [Pseudomonadota bacterium]|nr:helix-turn-helix transcriptional regulator [Pseudomonadota bacterium]
MSPLRKARRERELSIYEVADMVGVSAASISRMERRLQCPSVATAAKLGSLLGLTLEQILLPEPPESEDKEAP